MTFDLNISTKHKMMVGYRSKVNITQDDSRSKVKSSKQKYQQSTGF